MDFPSADQVKAGLEAYNLLLAEVWSFKQGELEERFAKAGRQLAEGDERVKAIEDVELELTHPPTLRFDSVTQGAGRLKVVLTAPGSASWSFRIRARVRLPWPFSRRGHIVKLAVKRLRLTIELEVERQSPVSASLVDSRVKVDIGDVDLDSPSFILKLFTGLASFFLDLLNHTIEDVARDALAENLPQSDTVEAMAALGLASEPVKLSPDPPPSLAQVEEQVVAISERVGRHHMPWDTVLNTAVPKDDPEAPATGYLFIHDSAIWSGHFLAGEVLRYTHTQDPRAAENVRRALRGFDALIHLAGPPGLLSRVLIPLDSPHAAALRQDREEQGQGDRLFTGVFDGVEYQSLGHITRDQYVGAFLGTGLAAVLMDDVPGVGQEARTIAIQMAEYLIEERFCPTEATVDPVTGTRLTSVTFLANPGQVLAILQVARTLDPDTYGARFEAFFPVWAIAWLFLWLQTTDPHDSYFKFNLEHSAALVLLMLETDPARKAQLSQGLQVQRRALRFHANAYFNLVELETLGQDPASLSRPRPELEAETRHLLAQALKRPPLIENVELEPEDRVSLPTGEFIARQPVAVTERPGTDFLWQRSPFALRVVWDVPEDVGLRSPGVDVTLPYWMARRLGL